MTRWRKITLIATLLAIVIVIGSAFVAIQFNRPKHAVIHVGSGISNPTSYTIDLTPTLKTGKYISFLYPRGLVQQKSETLHPPLLETFTFLVRDARTWLLAIDVSTTPHGTLTDNSSYNLRKASPSQYSMSTLPVNHKIVTIMSDKTVAGFREVAYLINNHELATVSLDGDDSTGVTPLQTSFMMVLDSWRWLSP